MDEEYELTLIQEQNTPESEQNAPEPDQKYTRWQVDSVENAC